MHRRTAGRRTVAARRAQPLRHGPRRDRAREPGQPGAGRFASTPQDRGVLGGQLHLPAKAKRVIYLFMAGGPSQMEMFDYKPLLKQRNGEQLPDSVRQGQRLTGMSGNQSSLAAGRVAVQVQPARQERRVGQRAAAAHREDRRRPLHRPLDVHRGDQSRSGDHVLPDRLADCRPAQHGRVAHYGLGSDNEDLPAFVVLITPGKVDQPLYSRLWGSGFLPSRASGRAVPQRQGPGAVSRQSRRRHARQPPAAARPLARTARARRGSAGRHRGRLPHRPVRDGVPDADQRART